jgi:hypothetical protein
MMLLLLEAQRKRFYTYCTVYFYAFNKVANGMVVESVVSNELSSEFPELSASFELTAP